MLRVNETNINEHDTITDTFEKEHDILADTLSNQMELMVVKQRGARGRKQNKAFNRTICAMLLCGAVSFAAAYGGAALGNGNTALAGTASGNTSGSVIYQSVAATGGTTETGGTLTVGQIADLASDSVVEIVTETVTNGMRMGQFVSEGAGSGVVITTDGYIVTNNHVIEGASKISVRISNGESYEATLIGTDSQTDIAVLKIDAPELTPAVFGTSSSLQTGELAVAIGNPLGELGGTVTDGIISALDREITIDGENMTLLQTNAAINPGNSGGGLFNSKGELIGIVNAKSSGTDVEGLGFAIPIDTAKVIIEELIQNGRVSGRPSLGVSLVEISDAATAMMYRVSELGVYVAEPGDTAFEPGDMIISINGVEVASAAEIKEVINNLSVGDTIAATVLRGNAQKSLSVDVQEA